MSSASSATRSSAGKRSFAAMLPDNAYGNVVEGSFSQAASRRNARVIALERYGADRNQMQGAARNIAQALPQADSLLLADDGEALAGLTDSLTAAGAGNSCATCSCSAPVCGTIRACSAIRRCRAACSPRPIRPAIARSPAATAPSTIRNRCARRRWPTTRSRWSPRSPRRRGRSASRRRCCRTRRALPASTDCSASRRDGTNDRGLAVMRVSSSGAQVAAAAPQKLRG